MKTRILKFCCFAILLFTFFGCCENCETELEETKKELKTIRGSLKDCQDNSTHGVVEFITNINPSNKDKYQLIHIEGKYEMPYFISAKFETEGVTSQNNSCDILNVHLKINSLNGYDYSFYGTPFLEENDDGKLHTTMAIIEGSSNTLAKVKIKTPDGKITSFRDQLIDVHVDAPKALKDKFKDTNNNYWRIKCCNGVICQGKIDF